MLTGKRFQLHRATLALDIVDGKRRAVTIPPGETIKVLSGPKDGDGTVDVLWSDRTLLMFEVDVNIRGAEIEN